MTQKKASLRRLFRLLCSEAAGYGAGMRTVLSAATEKRNHNNRHRSIPVPHAVFEVVRDQHAEPRAHQAEPRLLDRVREVIRFRHYSLRTEEAYLGWIRRFVRSTEIGIRDIGD